MDKLKSIFSKYYINHEIKGRYFVFLQKVEGGVEAFEIKGSIIVRIERIPLRHRNEVTEVLGITIATLEQLKLLVEGTRTWRFMQLP